MQRIKAIQQPTPREAVLGSRHLSDAHRFSLSLLLVAGLLSVVLTGLAARTRTIVERLVLDSYEEAITSLDRVHAAAASVARMRADQERRRTTTDRVERNRIDLQIEQSEQALTASLQVITELARSIRASQTALSVQETLTAWHDALHGQAVARDVSASGEDLSDFGRLATIADSQLHLLDAFTTRDGLDLRKSVESAVVDEVTRLVVGTAAACLILAGLALWRLRRRNRQILEAAVAVIDTLAAGRTGTFPSLDDRHLGPFLPALARLQERLQPADPEADLYGAAPGLASVLDAAADGFMVLDGADRIVFANAAAAQLLGLPQALLEHGLPADAVRARLGLREGGTTNASVRHRSDGRRLRLSVGSMADGGVMLVFGAGIVPVPKPAEPRPIVAQSDAAPGSGFAPSYDDGLESTSSESAPAPVHRAGELRAIADGADMQTALDTMSQGLCLYDATHRVVVVNRRYEEIYHLAPGAIRRGLTAREVIALSIAAGNHPGRTLDELLDEAAGFLRTGDQDDHFQEVVGGRVVQIRARPTPAGGLVATYEDVTERWHAEARIAYMARHDALTDLPNRLLLAERIEGAITQASRENGFALHCLDLDNFKQINDTLGHAVGDELLRAVAHRLMACLRETDTVARLGGDEFAIVQTDVDRAENAAVLARHVIEVVSAPYTLTDHRVTVGVSIGIALAPADGMASDRLMKNGDVALYRAKGDGRGVFRFFEPEMDARLQARRLLELDLRAAIAAEAFELHYQPIYSLGRERICGFEALLRWTHPIRGRVSPAEFIPLAEEIGLIVPLGDWVLQRACAEAAGWSGDLKIAVNVSPAQFRSAHLIGTVRETLERTGLAANRLELEITETVLLANRGATVAILHALRTIGVRIAMDDFGTGYSSLSYLRSFPFDKMKIDQSFIRDLTAENGSGFIVRAVISLGSSLGMIMTAEGVETEAQLARLREEGCDEVQGYLFSPPVPAAEVPGLLIRWNGADAAAQAA